MFCPMSNYSFKSTHVDEDMGTKLLISFSEEEAKAENRWQSLDVVTSLGPPLCRVFINWK